MLVHEIAATNGSKPTIKFTRTCENFASLSTNILHYGFSLFLCAGGMKPVTFTMSARMSY